MKGTKPPKSLNDAIGAFIPKISDAADGLRRGLHRIAGDTRPLNVDSQLMAAATCYKLLPDLDDWVDSCQRGFMRAREALANIVEFDGAARAAALLAGTPPPEGVGDEDSAQPCPISFFFDFAAAFPSVSRRYLREVMKAPQLPVPLQRFLKALLTRTTVALCIDGMRFEGWDSKSGVPQG